MRMPHKLAHNLALITVLLTLPFLAGDAAAQVPCETPPAQPEGKITAWKQGATVNVMIDPTFSSTQQQAIKDQFNKWKNAGGANVTFNFVEPRSGRWWSHNWWTTNRFGYASDTGQKRRNSTRRDRGVFVQR